MNHDERIAIVRRLREALERQRDRFHQYLNLLEHQQSAIDRQDTDQLRQHVDLEREVVGEITALQKVISPMQDLYHAAYPAAEPAVGHLEMALTRAREQVLARNTSNQKLLSEKMDALRLELREFRRRRGSSSPFAAVGTPSVIDITA